jgi:hypothetical protein
MIIVHVKKITTVTNHYFGGAMATPRDNLALPLCLHMCMDVRMHTPAPYLCFSLSK